MRRPRSGSIGHRLRHDPNAPDTAAIQPGWEIHSRDGVLVGHVLSVNRWYLHVRTSEGDRSIVLEPGTIIEQETSERRARVSLDALAMSRP